MKYMDQRKRIRNTVVERKAHVKKKEKKSLFREHSLKTLSEVFKASDTLIKTISDISAVLTFHRGKKHIVRLKC